jgi:hypothetical protein
VFGGQIVHDQIGCSVESVLDALDEIFLVGVLVRLNDEDRVKFAQEVAKMSSCHVADAMFGS